MTSNEENLAPLTHDDAVSGPTEEFQDIQYYPLLKVDRLYAGFPVFIQTPVYKGRQGETVLVDDGSTRQVCAYLNGNWRCRNLQAEPPQTMSLLHAASGTNTNSSANDIDTVAISGLTALDTIMVYITIGAVAHTATVKLRNSTDAVDLMQNSWQVTAGNTIADSLFCQQGIDSVNTVDSIFDTVPNGVLIGSGVDSTLSRFLNSATFTQSWQGSWTLALRSAGISAGGTIDWSWKVYKLSGQ